MGALCGTLYGSPLWDTKWEPFVGLYMGALSGILYRSHLWESTWEPSEGHYMGALCGTLYVGALCGKCHAHIVTCCKSIFKLFSEIHLMKES